MVQPLLSNGLAYHLERFLLVELSMMSDTQLDNYLRSLSPEEFDDLISIMIDHLFDPGLDVLALLLK